MPVAKPGADLAHAVEGAILVGQLDHAETERQFTSEAGGQTQLAHIAQMAGQGSFQDRDDAEALALGQRGQKAAFGDPEHWRGRRLATGMQARVAEAGDHERRGVVPPAHEPAERLHDLLDMGLRLDPGRTIGQRQALELRATGHAQRLESVVDRRGHRLGRVRIDHDDALAHRGSSPKVLLDAGLQHGPHAGALYSPEPWQRGTGRA